MNQRYKLGLRAVKTAVAVFICMFFANFFNRSDGFFASVAAIICIQQTYDKTFKIGLQRFVGTLIGGGTGYIILEFIHVINFSSKWINTIIIPFCLLFVIYVCNVIDYKGSVVIGGIVLISVLLKNDSSGALIYIINRIIDTTTGIAIAMIINRFFLPEKNFRKES